MGGQRADPMSMTFSPWVSIQSQAVVGSPSPGKKTLLRSANRRGTEQMGKDEKRGGNENGRKGDRRRMAGQEVVMQTSVQT